MRKLVILRGNSGSGKSTLATRLQRELGRSTLVIPQDTVRREMLWARDGAYTAALPLLRTLLRYGYEHSEVTILEGILAAEWYRPLFQDAVELFGENIFAYYYDLPFEETLRRHETKPNRFDFGEADMRRWWREKDYIGFIPERTIRKDISLEEAVKNILSDVQYQIGGYMPEIYLMTPGHPYWNETITFAENCSWRAGPYLANKMRNNDFLDWERICAACIDGEVAGFCTFAGEDELPEEYNFTPFIGFVFVGEAYRGKRLSEKMIQSIFPYALGLGYEKIYLMSGELGLYEKYGFEKIGDYETIYGTTDQLFEKSIV